MRYRSLEVAVCAMLAAAAAVGQTSNPTKASKQDRQPLAQEEQASSVSSAEAESELRAQVKQHPDAAAPLYRLALILRQDNKPRESLDVYSKAAQLQKPDAAALRSVALDYVLLNDFDDAIHWLRIALGLEPNNVEVLYSLGRCLYTQNQFPPAEAAFTRVLQLDPSHFKAEENLGLTYDAENRPVKAEKALRAAAQQAEQHSAADPWPFLDLGTFLLEQAKPGEAVPFLRKAVNLEPSNARAHEKLGRALAAAGDPASGAIELQKAIELDPRNAKFHFELGHAYREAGQEDKATTEFARSKELYGEHQQN